MGGLSRVEAEAVRSEIKLRMAPDGWQVWTLMLGSTVWKWIKISDAEKQWFAQNFNPPVIEHIEPADRAILNMTKD